MDALHERCELFTLLCYWIDKVYVTMKTNWTYFWLVILSQRSHCGVVDILNFWLARLRSYGEKNVIGYVKMQFLSGIKFPVAKLYSLMFRLGLELANFMAHHIIGVLVVLLVQIYHRTQREAMNTAAQEDDGKKQKGPKTTSKKAATKKLTFKRTSRKGKGRKAMLEDWEGNKEDDKDGKGGWHDDDDGKLKRTYSDHEEEEEEDTKKKDILLLDSKVCNIISFQSSLRVIVPSEFQCLSLQGFFAC
jgi:hypothetical protein